MCGYLLIRVAPRDAGSPSLSPSASFRLGRGPQCRTRLGGIYSSPRLLRLLLPHRRPRAAMSPYPHPPTPTFLILVAPYRHIPVSTSLIHVAPSPQRSTTSQNIAIVVENTQFGTCFSALLCHGDCHIGTGMSCDVFKLETGVWKMYIQVLHAFSWPRRSSSCRDMMFCTNDSQVSTRVN